MRRFYAAWTADDLDGVLAVVHPHIVFQPILGMLYEHPAFLGHEGMTQHLHDMHERWDTFGARVERTFATEEGLIAFVALSASRGERGYDARIAVEVGFRDGLIVSFVGRDIYDTAEELGVEA